MPLINKKRWLLLYQPKKILFPRPVTAQCPSFPACANTLVSFINRSGKIIIPTGNDSIEVGDSVMIVTKNKGFTTLTDILR